MTNWQKQVNSQLRLTPLFQLLLVDYQGKLQVLEREGKRQHGLTGLSRLPEAPRHPPLLAWCLAALTTVGAQEKPLDAHKLGILLPPKADGSVCLQRRAQAGTAWWECLEEVFGMAGLASLRTTDLFPCKSVSEGLWYRGFLCPQTSCDWHSPGQGLEVTTQYLPVSWHADTEDSLFTVSKHWLN